MLHGTAVMQGKSPGRRLTNDLKPEAALGSILLTPHCAGGGAEAFQGRAWLIQDSCLQVQNSPFFAAFFFFATHRNFSTGSVGLLERSGLARGGHWLSCLTAYLQTTRRKSLKVWRKGWLLAVHASADSQGLQQNQALRVHGHQCAEVEKPSSNM